MYIPNPAGVAGVGARSAMVSGGLVDGLASLVEALVRAPHNKAVADHQRERDAKADKRLELADQLEAEDRKRRTARDTEDDRRRQFDEGRLMSEQGRRTLEEARLTRKAQAEAAELARKTKREGVRDGVNMEVDLEKRARDQAQAEASAAAAAAGAPGTGVADPADIDRLVGESFFNLPPDARAMIRQPVPLHPQAQADLEGNQALVGALTHARGGDPAAIARVQAAGGVDDLGAAQASYAQRFPAVDLNQPVAGADFLPPADQAAFQQVLATGNPELIAEAHRRLALARASAAAPSAMAVR